MKLNAIIELFKDNDDVTRTNDKNVEFVGFKNLISF